MHACLISHLKILHANHICKVSVVLEDSLFSSKELECGYPCMCVCAQLCVTLCDTMDCSLPGTSVYGVLQANIQEWVAISFTSGPSCPRD